MRNSAWYHKLWRNKLDSLPIKDTSDASWAGMHKLLNEQMPIGTISGQSPNLSIGAKLIKILGYSLSVAVTVSAVIYFTVPQVKDKKKEIDKKIKPAFSDSTLIDSGKVLNYSNLTDTTSIKDSVNGDGIEIDKVTVQSKSVDQDVKQVNGIEVKAQSSNLSGVQIPDDLRGLAKLTASSLMSFPKADINEYSGQNVNRSSTIGGRQLLKPNKFEQGITFSNDMLPPVSILIDQNGILPVQATGHSRDASSTNRNSGETNQKEEGIALSKAPKVKSVRPSKTKIPGIKKEGDATVPAYSYGVTSGINVQKGNTGFYAGLSGAYSISKKWQVSVGLNMSSYQKIAGEFSHPSYYRPDSLPPFTITGTGKVLTMDVPLTVAHKLSKHISIKAGPVFIFPIRQSGITAKLNPIADLRDTLYHSKEINTALANTVVNKVYLGVTGGISIHIKQFDINSSYQWLKPYKVSDSLGYYHQTNLIFRIGLGYRFK